MNSDLRFYISVFLRRIHIFFLVALTITAAAVTLSLRLPAYYTADALLLIEAPQIPDELAASTVRTNPTEQLEIIEQRLLTRANLLDIANEHDVYDAEDRLLPDEIVEDMRAATTFTARSGRNRATLFTVQFEAREASTSAAVVNAYINRVLSENIELRTERAEDTMNFFDQEVERLGEDLARQSQRILEFKNANIGALPESLDYRLERQTALRERIAQNQREIEGLGQQRERLILIFNATGGVGQAQPEDTRRPEERELAALQNELETALSIYSEQNPRVRVLRSRVAALEEKVSQLPEVIASGGGDNRSTLLDIQLQEIDSRIERLEAQQGELATELELLAMSIETTPGNAVALDALERDYENIQSQYNQAVARQSAAATGERIELLSKGERILVLSQPVVPRLPSSPNRPLIAGGGLFLGVLLGGLTVFLLELMNKSVRRPVDLTRSLGIVPLATVPMIRTPGESTRRKSAVLLLFLGFVIGIPVVLYYVHFFILPLDLVFDRLINAVGF
ncbi:MAG: lipopolysaccharide biosynthesis [Alphaproteobacteria bacterium]|nr:lipopolysaccharide biosynthesis [Alphaproteobacteria bacterium]